ncbi:MAG: cupin domain-containing protein [Candidatus Loosdrechtia sp.]|uniref:cupin domain-containing protein n=1 Tax=Candidatus Loosdrechtia sp. TaxID=3101272 RepID=UPI003A670A08|nr:MAG: cupin domain-containing protein [Candidatus Jettenia sp. AMX2]
MKIISLSDLPDESVSHNPEIKKRVMLREGEIPYLTNFSQARFKSGQTSGAHAHENLYEVFYVEAGEGIIRIEDREYQVKKGFCIMTEPGEIHNIINTFSSELVITYFGLKVEKNRKESITI